MGERGEGWERGEEIRVVGWGVMGGRKFGCVVGWGGSPRYSTKRGCIDAHKKETQADAMQGAEKRKISEAYSAGIHTVGNTQTHTNLHSHKHTASLCKYYINVHHMD